MISRKEEKYMAEADPFSNWESEVFDSVPRQLPDKPDTDENIIDFAKRLQLVVGSYPDIDQYLVARDALDILKENVGYDILGRRLFIHAMRGYIFSDKPDSHIVANHSWQSFHATGFLEPFTVTTLPTESSISLRLKFPMLLADDQSPIAAIETNLPLAIPVLAIQDHVVD